MLLVSYPWFISTGLALFLFILLIWGCLAHGVFSVLSLSIVRPDYSYSSYGFIPKSSKFFQPECYSHHKLSPQFPKFHQVPQQHPYTSPSSTKSWLLLSWQPMLSYQSSHTITPTHRICSSALIPPSRNLQNCGSMCLEFSTGLLSIICCGSWYWWGFIWTAWCLICPSVGLCFRCGFWPWGHSRMRIIWIVRLSNWRSGSMRCWCSRAHSGYSSVLNSTMPWASKFQRCCSP